MSFDRYRAAMRTFRFRLMVWNAGVVLLTAVVTLIGVREGVRRALLSEMDQILIEDAQEIGLTLGDVNPILPDEMQEFINRKAQGHKKHGWFARLIYQKGKQLWASDDALPETESKIPMVNLKPISRAGDRVVQLDLTDRRGQSLHLRVGASLDFLDRDMSVIDRLVAMAVAVVLLAAPLLGYWLAGRTTETLRQLIRTTANLRPTRLDERLPIRKTGDELDQLSQTFNGLLDRIADYLEHRRDFLANSAHELRTPVAAIRSTVEVALGADRTKEEYEELLSEVIEECHALEVLVNQLLLLAETEGDRMGIHGERVPFDSIVRTATEMFRALAESREIELKLTRCTASIIEGNRHHLRQVLNNLLDNAIKFTLPGGQIEVSLERQGRQAVLKVRDTGIGMSSEDLPHIFDRFFRCDRARTHTLDIRGTGLGLSICQAVVSAHRGHLYVESEEGKGTCFTAVLPCVLPETSTPALEPSADAQPALPPVESR
jgi:two-component system, OmpR family, heavy metal sensor histidine kinase CusS